MQKKIIAIFKVKVTPRAHLSKIWLFPLYFLLYFWTADSLAARPRLMVHHYKSMCVVNKKAYCTQGQGQSRGSKCWWFQILFKPPNVLLPNLVWWCIIMSWSDVVKNWFAIFKVEITARAFMIKIWQFLLYLLGCWPFCYQTWFVGTLSKAGVSYEETG